MRKDIRTPHQLTQYIHAQAMSACLKGYSLRPCPAYIMGPLEKTNVAQTASIRLKKPNTHEAFRIVLPFHITPVPELWENEEVATMLLDYRALFLVSRNLVDTRIVQNNLLANALHKSSQFDTAFLLKQNTTIQGIKNNSNNTSEVFIKRKDRCLTYRVKYENISIPSGAITTHRNIDFSELYHDDCRHDRCCRDSNVSERI